jgi:tRNA threonylcarbamoyladenosine modification (KEOPS) complex Cgi121 subunit
MSPLLVQEVFVGTEMHQIGVFGFTRSTPLMPDLITELTRQVKSTHKLTLQLVDADLVAGPDHLLFATLHAYTAFHHKTNRASTLAMEILRFAAAQRQIAQALTQLGVSNSTRRFGGVLTNSTASSLETAYRAFLSIVEGTDDSSILEITSEQKEHAIRETFQIPKDELVAISPSMKREDRRQALKKIVYDRCALLAISR